MQQKMIITLTKNITFQNRNNMKNTKRKKFLNDWNISLSLVRLIKKKSIFV